MKVWTAEDYKAVTLRVVNTENGWEKYILRSKARGDHYGYEICPNCKFFKTAAVKYNYCPMCGKDLRVPEKIPY